MVLLLVTGVADVANQFGLNEATLGGRGVMRVIGNVQVEVHLLLMHSQVKYAARVEA